MEKLTVQDLLENFNSVYKGIVYAEYQKPPCPSKPEKPYLSHNHNIDDVEQYKNELKVYLAEKYLYETTLSKYLAEVQEINEIIEEYIKQSSGFYEIVPAQYQQRVYEKAYAEGPPNGYHEVYVCLINLIEIFE